MSDNETASPEDFGLIANDEIPGDDAADETTAALEAEVDRFIEMEGDEDNLERYERLERERAEREEAQREEAEDGEDDGEEAEGEDAEEGDEAEGEEEGKEGSSAQLSIDEIRALGAEDAQAALDALLEAHGETLTLRYRGGGGERAETWAQVKQRAAAALGQNEVAQQLEQARAAETRAEQVFQQAQALYEEAKSTRETLLSYVQKDPKAFVNEVLLRHGTPQAMLSLRDELDEVIHRVEADPYTFEATQQTTNRLDRIEQMMQQILRGGPTAGNGGAAASSGHAGTGPHETPMQGGPTQGQQDSSAPGDIPDDFGFIPGQGYPGQYSRAAEAALVTAARVAGIDAGEVLDVWDNEGRKEPVDRVLERMARERFAETSKVETAKKRGTRRAPAARRGGVRVPKQNPSARKAPRWDDLEAELARELEQLEG